MKLAVVDLSSFLYRHFHGRPAVEIGGVNVNGVKGVESLLLSIMQESEFSHVVFAADSETSVRRLAWSAYKSSRVAPCEDLQRQMQITEQLLQHYEVPVVRCEGWEADDVIASLVERIGGRCPVGIYSGDKDLRQLLRVSVWLCRHGRRDQMTISDLWFEFGLRPEQIVDWLALMGDDDVPGVPGIGKKIAVELLQQHGSIDGILAARQTLTEKKRDAFEANASWLMLARWMHTLKRDLPLERIGEAARISLVDGREFWADFSNGRMIADELRS